MKTIRFYFVFLIILVPQVMMAQPGDPGGDPFQQIPIDGGLFYLLAAGISFGIYKLRGKKKQ